MRTGALLAVMAAATVIGCGGGDTKTVTVSTPSITNAAAPLTKADYIRRLDAICSEANATAEVRNRELEDLLKLPDTAETRGRVAALFERYADRDDAYRKQMEAVPAAASYRTQAGVYHESANMLAPLMRRMASAVGRGDVEELEVLDRQVSEIVMARNAAARAFGFKRCGGQG